MKFDKSRVYTALNADELHKGDKVIVADTLSYLRRKVTDGSDIEVLKAIRDDNCTARFGVEGGCFDLLAYLVERAENCTNCNTACLFQIRERPELNKCKNWTSRITTEIEVPYGTIPEFVSDEKHYRPFKDVDELTEEWDKKLNYRDPTGLAMPYIWVKRKEANTKGQLITEFGDGWGVGIGRGEAYNMTDLLTYFTFLDGSPCGVEE